MHVLILHASPKKKGGASRFFAGLFSLFLPGTRKKTVSINSRQDFQRALELFPGMDVVCFFVPLYVDGLPSHVMEFLSQAEKYCKNHSCRFRLYAVANNGFVEGKQNREVTPKSCTRVMRQSRFEFCIGQDLTHSIFL